MFDDNITGEILFNDPHTLAKYLDDLSGEVEVSYVHRKGEYLVEHMDSINQDFLFEITKKESQLKLLVDFVGILMDKSQDKIQQQVDTIDKLENEIKEIKEERASTNMELSILKQNFDSFQEKYKKMEMSFLELEEKYDTERLSSNKKKMEVQALSTIKDKYTEVKTEERRKTVMNMKLSEEKSIMEARIGVQISENRRLKEELKLREADLAELRKSLDDITRVKFHLEKQSKDYESEREACICEIQNLRTQMEELNSRCESFEHELVLARSASNTTTSNREEIPETALDNLNLKISKVTSQQPFLKQRSKSNARDSVCSFTGDNQLDDKSSTFKNYINVDDLQMEQYENLRLTITREETREFPSFGARKSRMLTPDKITLPSPHAKDDRNYQSSWDSNASTEAPGKTEKPAGHSEQPTEVNTATSVAESVTTTPVLVKEKPKMKLEPGKRKDILEEFYLLTWQSVLLNSPNFNDIAGWVDSTTIYEEINKNGVPFFQWYTWLGNKLQEVYKSHLLPEIRERRATTIKTRRQTKV